MKKFFSLILTAAAISVSAAVPQPLTVNKAGVAPPVPATTTATAKWIDSLSINPVGVIKTADLDGRSQWGAGLDIGIWKPNPFFEVHAVGLSFEGAGKSTHWEKSKNGYDPVSTGEDDWGGRLVDEVALIGRATINRFSNESFKLRLCGGGQYDLNADDWGVNVGLDLEYVFNKWFSLSGGYSVRPWFHKPTHVDSLASLQVNIKPWGR